MLWRRGCIVSLHLNGDELAELTVAMRETLRKKGSEDRGYRLFLERLIKKLDAASRDRCPVCGNIDSGTAHNCAQAMSVRRLELV